MGVRGRPWGARSSYGVETMGSVYGFSFLLPNHRVVERKLRMQPSG